MPITILSTPVDNFTLDEAQKLVGNALKNQGQFFIVTPNPEMMVDAIRNQRFGNVLRHASLRIPDGMGVKIAAWYRRQPLKARITGTDFLRHILELAIGKRVYFLGAKGDTALRAAENLRAITKGWEVAGAEDGGEKRIDEKGEPILDPELIERINAAKPDILFVAWGHPDQELWLDKALPALPSVRVAMGVGGAFDFYAGNIRRAPGIMRVLGFEWVWRLVLQPWRWRRILKALIVFPWLVITRKS